MDIQDQFWTNHNGTVLFHINPELHVFLGRIVLKIINNNFT